MTTTGRPATLLVAAPWLLTLALFPAVAAIAALAATSPSFGMDLSTASFLLLIGLWALVQSSVGTAIAWRRPENRIGRLMQLSGPLILSVFLGFLMGALRYLDHGSTDIPGGLAAWWGSAMLLPIIFLAFPALGILFPDGRLPSPWFRLPTGIVIAVLAAVTAVYALAKGQLNEGLPDNPFGLVDLPNDVVALAGLAGGVALVAAMALAIAAVAVRWRRGSPIERAQLKWLLAPLTLGVGSFGFAFGSSLTDLSDLVSFVSALLLPVAVGIAVLRYRLYEIDRLISRSVSWAVVTGVLALVFVAVVVTLQAVLAGVTQGETLAVAASTLVAFALFQPVRRRVQHVVDRRFDRARVDGEHTSERFADRVRNEVDLLTLRLALVRTTDQALRPMASGVWLRDRLAR